MSCEKVHARAEAAGEDFAADSAEATLANALCDIARFSTPRAASLTVLDDVRFEGQEAELVMSSAQEQGIEQLPDRNFS